MSIRHQRPITDSETVYSRLKGNESQESISTLTSDLSDDDQQIQELDTPRRSSATSVTSQDGHSARSSKDFLAEASVSIYDSLKQGHEVANIQLELQALRMSSNASEHDVRRAVVTALVRYAVEMRQHKVSVKTVLAQNKALIEKTIFDEENGQPRDQTDLLLLLQSELCKYEDGSTILAQACNDLYVMDDFTPDLFEAEAFQSWWADTRSVASESLRTIRSKTEKVMQVIEENEQEDDDDETDDDEEE